jgi:hypothetical protein
MEPEALPLDGNAAAGPLAEAFAFELTSAVGACAGCGAERAMGAAAAFLQAPGLVLRCPDCDTVLLRAARTEPAGGPRLVIDLRGLRRVTIELG